MATELGLRERKKQRTRDALERLRRANAWDCYLPFGRCDRIRALGGIVVIILSQREPGQAQRQQHAKCETRGPDPRLLPLEALRRLH